MDRPDDYRMIKKLFDEQQNNLRRIEDKMDSMSEALFNPDEGLYRRIYKNSEDISMLRLKIDEADLPGMKATVNSIGVLKRYASVAISSSIAAAIAAIFAYFNQ